MRRMSDQKRGSWLTSCLSVQPSNRQHAASERPTPRSVECRYPTPSAGSWTGSSSAAETGRAGSSAFDAAGKKATAAQDDGRAPGHRSLSSAASSRDSRLSPLSTPFPSFLQLQQRWLFNISILWGQDCSSRASGAESVDNSLLQRHARRADILLTTWSPARRRMSSAIGTLHCPRTGSRTTP